MKIFPALKYFFVLILFFIISFIFPNRVVAENSPNLTLVSHIFTSVRDVDTSGNYLFASYENGIGILDITDPAYPLLTGNLNGNGCSYVYLDIFGNTLFSTQSSYGNTCLRDNLYMHNSLHVIDVTDKSLPTELGSVTISGPGGATNTEQSGVYNFFTNAHGGLVIINVTNPADPEIVDTFTGTGSTFMDVEIVGLTAYLGDATGKLWIIDITNPLALNVLSQESIGSGAMGVKVLGNYAYIASSIDGLKIVDIRNPVNPSVVGSINWMNEVPSDSDTLDVDVSGNYAYVANGRMGVFVVDVTDPGNPFEVARYDLDGYTTRIKYGGGYIFAADAEKGLNILKFGNTPTPTGVQLSVPLFKQNDPAWGGLTYDSAGSNPLFCGSTVGQCGCALSSIAMILKYHGVDRDPEGNPTTPETVNKFFLRDKKCDEFGCSSLGYSYGNVLWGAAGLYSKASNDVFNTQKVVFKGKADFDIEVANAMVENEKPLAIRVPGSQHWVVATGQVDNTLAINDPGYSRTRLDDPAYGNTALASRFYEKTASDFSSFEVASKAPTQLLVTDSQGRKTGFNPMTNSVVEEIPSSSYEFEGAYSDPTGVNPSPPESVGIYIVEILTPQQNTYNVQIVGVPNSLFGFSVHASDKDANTDLNLFEGNIPQTGYPNYVFNYSPDPAIQEKFTQEINIDIWPFVKINKIFRKVKLPTPVGILSSSTFNAPKDLDKQSLTFGRTGDEKSLIECAKFYIDLNRDKLKDVYCLFSTQKAGFINGDTTGILKGKAKNDLDVLGKDKVVVY